MLEQKKCYRAQATIILFEQLYIKHLQDNFIEKIE